MTNVLAIADKPAKILADEIFEGLDVAETTRQEYKWRIGAFLTFVGNAQLTTSSYLDFKRSLQARGDLAVASKNKYLVAGRVLLKELHRRGLVPIDITANVRLLRQSKKHKRDGLDDIEMVRLTSWMREQPQTPSTSRIAALVYLLAFQGLRQIEVCRLDVADVDFMDRTLLVQGKGRDDKEPVDLLPETAAALKRYMKVARVGDGPLFPSRHPGAEAGQRLTPRSVRRIVGSLLAELGIDKTTHGFRHWFITRLCEAYAGDVLTVRRYTRHNSLEMLQTYDDRRKQRADLPNFYRAFEGVHM